MSLNRESQSSTAGNGRYSFKRNHNADAWIIGQHNTTPLLYSTSQKIRCAIDIGDDADLDRLNQQLATLECDPQATIDHFEDGFDTGDAVGKALALIEQVKSMFIADTIILLFVGRFASHRKPEHSSKSRARKTFPPLSFSNGSGRAGHH